MNVRAKGGVVDSNATYPSSLYCSSQCFDLTDPRSIEGKKLKRLVPRRVLSIFRLLNLYKVVRKVKHPAFRRVDGWQPLTTSEQVRVHTLSEMLYVSFECAPPRFASILGFVGFVKDWP